MNINTSKVLFILNILLFKFFLIKSDEVSIRDVRPIIGEMFDMLLEDIEKNRRIRENNKIKENKYMIEKDVNLTNGYNKDNIFDENFDKIKIIERDIIFTNDKVNLMLNLNVNKKFKKDSVLVFKNWNNNFANYNVDNGDYNKFCSSSNINNDILISSTKFNELSNFKENNLIFKLSYDLDKVINKTFLICLSDSITSNYSIFITKLSFSKMNMNDDHEIEDEENSGIVQLSNTSDYIGKYIYQDLGDEEYNKIYVKLNIPKNHFCLDHELLVVDNQNNTVLKGELNHEKKINGDWNICFWILNLMKDHFNNTDILNLIEFDKPNKLKNIIGKINYSVYKDEDNLILNSTIFKILFLTFKLLPIILVIYCLVVIIIDFSDFISHIFSETLNQYSSKLQSLDSKLKSSNEFRIQIQNSNIKDSIEKKRILNWYKNSKEKGLNNLNSIINNQSFNNDESNNSSNEQYNDLIKSDPLKYFDSDCSISTYTGI